MKKLAIGTMSIVASLAMAAGNTSSGDQPLKILANVDLNMTKLSIGGDNGDQNLGANFDFGVAGDYFFTNELGAGVGLTWDMISGSKSLAGVSNKFSNSYIDIPVNFLYNWQASSNVSSIFGIGPYFGLPISKWTFKDPNSNPKITANSAFGLNIENSTTWQISDNFALGGHIFFKWDFADLMKEPAGEFNLSDSNTSTHNQTYYAFGIGASAKFL